VYSFEPSHRERRALRLHLLLNLCGNVSVQRVALGREKGRADLYVVQGHERGCNSLRQPKVEGGLHALSVAVETVDEWTTRARLESVDFIKIDVEGGELDVLKGASRLLEGRRRPVILAEVQDIRTAPWGYPAKDIISYLDERKYSWFSFLEGGLLAQVDLSATEFDGNFLAVPAERLAEVREFAIA
jgi:FkbM family methyltransferase